MPAPSTRHIEVLLPSTANAKPGTIAARASLSGISEKHGTLVKTGSLSPASSVQGADLATHSRAGSVLS